MSDIYLPHGYQELAEDWIMFNPAASLFLDMGLGKTVSSLSAIVRLRRQSKVKGVLVVGPLRVVTDVWPNEIAKWWHTEHLTFSTIRGNVTSRTRLMKQKDGSIEETKTKPSEDGLAALALKADIYLISYDVLPAFAVWCAKQKELPFDMIVWDESSKMKSHKGKRFKLMKPIYPRMKRQVILTGTPAPQSYLDLWSQYFILDQGFRLGKFITHFKDRHFEEIGEYGRTLRIRHGSAEIIESQIADITISMKAVDYLDMPELTINDVWLDMPSKARARYDELEANLFTQLKKGDVEALNQAALSGKCRQAAAGAIYLSERDDKAWEEIHTAKLDTLDDIVEDAQGTPILVVYDFKHDIARLRKRYPSAPWIGGGSKDASLAIKDWNLGKLKVMFVHPASIGHGVNLQAGGHILVFFTCPWSEEQYSQVIARLYRQGQKQAVIVHRLLMRNTVDVDVRASLADKTHRQNKLLHAIKLRMNERKSLQT